MALSFNKDAKVKQLTMGGEGSGSIMTFFQDPAVSSDAANQQWTEGYYDGKPESWCPDIAVHWHKYHDEVHLVLKGKISYTVDGVTKDYTPEDGELFIPRLVRHGLRFYPGVETLLRERTNPVNVGKQDFFEDLLGSGEPTFGRAMQSFYNGDCYPSFPGQIAFLEVAFVTVIGTFMNWWAPIKRATN